MTKTLREQKVASRKSTKDWRDRFKKKGGMIKSIPFDKEGVERLNRLRKENKKYKLGELIGFALITLENFINDKKKAIPSTRKEA